MSHHSLFDGATVRDGSTFIKALMVSDLVWSWNAKLVSGGVSDGWHHSYSAWGSGEV